MADTTTPVYSFVLPEIDGSDGTWGTKLNANLTALDGLLSGSANLQNASFTGTASFGGSTGTAGQVLKSQGAGANAIWTDDSNTTYTAGSGLSLTGTEFANTAPDQTVVMNAGSGISVSGTYPTFTVTNSSPDQTVGLTGTGGTTISGTYPNFTINSTDTNTTYTAGTGLTLTSTEFSVTDNGIGALQLNVSGNGTNGQVLASDGDGSFSWTSAGTGGNETLAQTLALGAVTGGTDISVSSGDNIVMAANSTVDGRDVSVDGAKLDLINQGVATTDSPAFAGLTVDTDTLYVDSTNNRVGIGTASPSSLLHLSSAGSTVLNVEATGANDSRLRITSGNSNTSYVEFADPDDVDTGEIRYEHATNNMQFRTAGNVERMRIDSSGHVGIGTSSPSAKLDVGGQGCFEKNYSYASTNYHIKLKSTYGNGISSYIGNVSSVDRMNISSGGYYYGASLYQLTDGATGMGAIGIGEDGTLTYQSTTGETANSTVNPAERMRIDSSGRVGIGTASPEYNLDVTAADNVTTTTALSVQNSSRNYGLGLGAYTLTNRNIGGSAATVDYTFDIGGDALFKTNNSERFRIDQSGNIGLRATSNVVSSTSGSGAWVSTGNYVAIARQGTSSAHPALYLNQTGVTGQVLQFRKDGTSVGSISTNGSSLPSDRNFKRNIESLDLGLDFVASLNPVTYNYKLDEEGQPVMTGLIAQEVEESLTAAGVEKNSMTLLQHTPTDDVKESDYQMDYLKLVPILINSIKEQQTLIESLTDRIAALEA